MVPIVLMPPAGKLEDLDKTTLKDGNTVYHILAKDGIFLRHSNELYSSVQKAKELAFLGELKESCIINFKPIPRKMLDEMTAFCAEVYRIHKGEAAIIMYYDRTAGQWTWDVPEQETSVNGLSVDYKQPPPPPEGAKMLGSAHSHGSASAFQSGTDQRDETNFDGVHITIGTLPDNPTYHVRLCISGATWKVDDDGLLIEKIERPAVAVDPELLKRVKPKTYASSQGVLYPGSYAGAESSNMDWFEGVIPSPESKPRNDFCIGLYRPNRGAVGTPDRVSPLEAEPRDFDRMGEDCWWAGEYLVKVGQLKGQWKLLTLTDREALHKAWDELHDWQRDDIRSEFTSVDRLRLLLATMSNKASMGKIHKRAAKKSTKYDRKWYGRTPPTEAVGEDKAIHQMSDQEYAEYMAKEWGG